MEIELTEKQLAALREAKLELDEATNETWLDCVKEARRAIEKEVEEREEEIFADIDELLLDCNADNWRSCVEEIMTKIGEVL